MPPGEYKSTGVPNSNNFDLDADGNGTSVVLWVGTEDLQRVRQDHEEYGVIAVPVAAWRGVNLRIARNPLPDNPNHCEIWGARTTAAKRKLAKAARWVWYPVDYPDELRTTE